MDIELMPTDRLTPHSGNPCRNVTAVDADPRSLEAFGWRPSIVVDRAGVIFVRHTRWPAVRRGAA